MSEVDEVAPAIPDRIVDLVLLGPDGSLVGRLAGLPVATPWWQDVEPVVAAARERYGIDVTVLRLLQGERDRPPGGLVTYLAEVARPVPAEPWSGALDDHPLRHAYARPGGPAADLGWAQAVLLQHELTPTAPAVQVRSWNLSSLWRIPVAGQTVWLKVVPDFLAHEGCLLERLAGENVPTLLGHDGGRSLLAEIPGEDLYDAEGPLLQEMVALLVGLQGAWLGRAGELITLGLPDFRGAALTAAIGEAVDRTADALEPGDRNILARFVAGLPDRFRQIADCGIGDTLVHGDFHPGNCRGGETSVTLLDWGDSGVGHPLLDMPAFLEPLGESAKPAVLEYWLDRWRRAIPGSDPASAARLIAPVAAARRAVVYRGFLDRIEPSEAPYHRADPAEWLQRAAALAAAEPIERTFRPASP